MKIKKLLSVTVILFLFSVKIIAQGEGNFWFFGDNAGMDFNPGAPIAITPGALVTNEGCAAISTSSGNLLFYTDGINIWNKLHATLPNGTGLLGDPSSTQSGIIVPKPGSSTIYYVFTVAAIGGPGGLCYSEVDMSLAGGLGDVVVGVKNVLLFTPVNEKLTAVKKSNNIDFWVIAHNNLNTQFLVYSVTSAGVSATPVTSLAGTFDTSGQGVGYMKASTNGSKIVAVLDYINIVDILNFNTTTGAVTLDFTFTPIFTFPYGAEFSADGSRLYLASESYPDVYQYNMSLGTSAAILASGTIIGTSSSGNGALQNAPDGKMYMAKWGSPTLSCIPNPNALGLACGFIDNAINLLGKTSTGGLPNFVQSYFGGSPIDYVNTCVGDTTFFSLQDSIVVDSIHWNFGDPASGTSNTSALYAPYHIFPAIGTYNVFVITYNGSVADTSTTIVSITGTPVISIGNDTAVCSGVAIVLDAGSGYTYSWQDASTNQTFNAASAGTYYVDVTNSCGTTTDTIHIAALPSPVVTVNDVSICSGQTANLTAGGASSYTWSAGATSTGTSTATASPFSTTTYTVTGTSSGCTSTDLATVTVHPIPAPAFTASVTSGCAPLCVQFNETVSTSCVSQSYNFGDGNSSTSSAPLYCYADSGLYTVNITCTDANGCVGSTSVTNMINVSPQPTASFNMSPSGIATPNTVISFTNTSPSGSNAVWDFDDPASGPANSSVLFSPSHTYASEGHYCATLTTSNISGCTDSVSHCIEIVNDIELPNVFTPNNDGKNDEFYIKDLHLGVADLKIYNRWGNLIYSSSAYNNDWKAEGVSDGVYYYIMYYPVNDKNYAGFVQIIQSK